MNCLKVISLVLLVIVPIVDSWWLSGSHVILDPRMTCKKSRRLKGKLAQICRNETALLREISRGVSLGAAECGYQFQYARWNCTLQRRSMKKILMRDTRETSFVNAITAAGVSYAITKACTAGDLLECSCERGAPSKLKILPEIKELESTQKWEWGGCSDNINFGLRKSREFMDSKYRRKSDIRIMIRLHNYNVGRMIIKKHMKLECKCHGLSGSCTLKTCWLKMPEFRDVGNILKEKFDGAAKVIANNRGDSFMPDITNGKKPGRQDLVYSEESSDFCKFDPKFGSLGTTGRRCHSTSQDIDGCNILCCGRGYTHQSLTENVNCRCRFIWCCNVTCDVCIENKDVYTCL